MKNEIITMVKKIGVIANKNSPTILTAIGVIGVVGTVVLAIKATPKAVQILEEREEGKKCYEETKEEALSKGEEYRGIIEQDFKEKVRKITIEAGIDLAKTYLPTVILGGVTIACIIGANRISVKRIASIGALYTSSKEALKKYQEKTLDTVGRTKESEIRGKVDDDRLKDHPLNNVIMTSKGDTLMYDPLIDRLFTYDIETFRARVNDFNRDLIGNMCMSLNEFYGYLGLGDAGLGNDVGWSAQKPLDFMWDSRVASDGRPCLVINYKDGPFVCYRDI